MGVGRLLGRPDFRYGGRSALDEPDGDHHEYGDDRCKQLDGDRPLQAGVGGFIDLSHPPGPDGGDDDVRAELST